jgi:hypothetical protein
MPVVALKLLRMLFGRTIELELLGLLAWVLGHHIFPLLPPVARSALGCNA